MDIWCGKSVRKAQGVILACLLLIKIVNVSSNLGVRTFETIQAPGMLISTGWMRRLLKN
jgi:hypothetical protein